MIQIRRPYFLIKDSDGSWSLLLTCRITGAFELYSMDMMTAELVSPVAVDLFQKHVSAFDMFVLFETEILCLHDCVFVRGQRDIEWTPAYGDIEKYTYEIAYPRGSHVHKGDSIYDTIVDTLNILVKIRDAVR